MPSCWRHFCLAQLERLNHSHGSDMWFYWAYLQVPMCCGCGRVAMRHDGDLQFQHFICWRWKDESSTCVRDRVDSSVCKRLDCTLLFVDKCDFYLHKNIESHTLHTNVSWPNPKQCLMIYTSDLMMIIRKSKNIVTTIKTEMCKLKTHNPIYCIKDNWDYGLDLRHTFNRTYSTFYIFSDFREVCFMMVVR